MNIYIFVFIDKLIDKPQFSNIETNERTIIKIL